MPLFPYLQLTDAFLFGAPRIRHLISSLFFIHYSLFFILFILSFIPSLLSNFFIDNWGFL